MLKLLLFFFSLPAYLLAAKISIVNDSQYFLHGKLLDRQHNQVGSFEIASGSTYIWYDSHHNAANYTQGPFSIILTCPKGSTYGKIFHVNNNSTVRAKSASGSKKCLDDDKPYHKDQNSMPPHNKHRYLQKNS